MEKSGDESTLIPDMHLFVSIQTIAVIKSTVILCNLYNLFKISYFMNRPFSFCNNCTITHYRGITLHVVFGKCSYYT